ncbi:MAG TPA: cytochrome c [Bacteroidia bacterium]|nr:cytochrome c [Bacteroidia bacterium]HNT79314.1 cytochrome c [Bacteroidia bacterium]
MKYHIHLYSKLSIAFIAVITLLSACKADKDDPGYVFMPDMYTSPSYETYGENTLFSDSLASRNPVEGTVARGKSQYFPYAGTTEGYEAAGNDIKTVATEISPEYLSEGKKLYGIYCMHCHGETGNGDGSLIATGKFPAPPSYSSGNSSRGGAIKDLSAGKIFHTITYGLNMMGPHASQVNYEERWKITAWVMELQKAGTITETEEEVANTDSTNTNVTN